MQRIEDQLTSRPRLSLSDTPQIESVLSTQYTPTTLCANECVRERTGRREQEQGNSKGKGKQGKKKAREKESEPLLSSLYFTFFALLYYGKSKGPLKEGKRKAREKKVKASEPLLSSLA